VFLVVQYEDMGVNEQMQHRIGNLPAFRIFSQAGLFFHTHMLSRGRSGLLQHALLDSSTFFPVLYSLAL